MEHLGVLQQWLAVAGGNQSCSVTLRGKVGGVTSRCVWTGRGRSFACAAGRCGGYRAAMTPPEKISRSRSNRQEAISPSIPAIAAGGLEPTSRLGFETSRTERNSPAGQRASGLCSGLRWAQSQTSKQLSRRGPDGLIVGYRWQDFAISPGRRWRFSEDVLADRMQEMLRQKRHSDVGRVNSRENGGPWIGAFVLVRCGLLLHGIGLQQVISSRSSQRSRHAKSVAQEGAAWGRSSQEIDR